MSKIANAFVGGKAFIGFLTAGDPNMQACERYILEMAAAGADLIEIGIPFSDPIAEGAVIQEANLRALSAGATTDSVFALVEKVREKTDIPLAFLTYINPVFNYGYQRFFERCKSVGIDGIIIPDMPYEEKGELSQHASDNDVDIITLIAPTSQQRIAQIAKEATGFVYLVSSMGVTGVRSQIQTDLAALVQSIRAATNTPIAVGFGISSPEQAQAIAAHADGVIVGSAIVKIIAQHGENAAEHIAAYVKQMKAAISK